VADTCRTEALGARSSMQSPGRGRRAAVFLAAIAAMVLGAAGQASAIDREQRLFDPWSAVKTVPAKPADDPLGEITCTYYPGLMVRETGTDTPDTGAATVVAYTGARPTCSKAAPAGSVTMKTQDFSLLGRKGPFLVFDAADPNGAVDFLVIAAATGKTLFTDAKSDTGGITAASLVGGVLHLKYRRGINADCSVLQNGAACWAKLVKAGALPASLAKAPLPVQACTSAYRKGQPRAPADDPSIILYDVETTVDLAGKSVVTIRGPVGCEPML
jgi:hypothetical protein